MRWSRGPLLGLLVVLAFFSHDVMMAGPIAGVPASLPPPPHALTSDTVAHHAAAPHPQGCQIGQAMVLKPSARELPCLGPAAFVGHPTLTLPAVLPSRSVVTRTRSPTAQRAVLQVFRL